MRAQGTVRARVCRLISRAPRMVVGLLSAQVAALMVLAVSITVVSPSAASVQLAMKPSSAQQAFTGMAAPASDPGVKYAADAARTSVLTAAARVAREAYLRHQAKLRAQATAPAVERVAVKPTAVPKASSSPVPTASASAAPSGGSGSSGGSSGCSDPSGQLSASQVGMLWLCAGGPSWAESQAERVALCESGYNTHAYNPSGASGLWQILGAVVSGDLFDGHVNALNAVSKFRSSGNSWAQWVCQP